MMGAQMVHSSNTSCYGWSRRSQGQVGKKPTLRALHMPRAGWVPGHSGSPSVDPLRSRLDKEEIDH